MALSRSLLVVALVALLCGTCAARPKAKCGAKLQYLNYKNKADNEFMKKTIADCLRRREPLPAGFSLPFKQVSGWWQPGGNARAGGVVCVCPLEAYCPFGPDGWCVCVPSDSNLC